MNKLESVKNWLVILVLLVATGVVTAVWPLLNLSFGFGGPTRPAIEGAVVTVPVPAFLVGPLGNELVLTSSEIFLTFLGLFAVVAVTVFVTGLVITFLVRMLHKSATAVAADPDYQQQVAALENRDKEKIQQARANSPKPNQPESYIYHLDPLSLSLIILLIVAFVGTLAYAVMSPAESLSLFGFSIDSRLASIITLFVITIPILIWRVRRQRLEAVLQKDNAPIPWDFIAILTTGLLIVGVGLGIMLYLSNSA